MVPPAILTYPYVVPVTTPGRMRNQTFVIEQFIRERRDFAVVESDVKHSGKSPWVVVYRGAEPGEGVRREGRRDIRVRNGIDPGRIVVSYDRGEVEPLPAPKQEGG